MCLLIDIGPVNQFEFLIQLFTCFSFDASFGISLYVLIDTVLKNKWFILVLFYQQRFIVSENPSNIRRQFFQLSSHIKIKIH